MLSKKILLLAVIAVSLQADWSLSNFHPEFRLINECNIQQSTDYKKCNTIANGQKYKECTDKVEAKYFQCEKNQIAKAEKGKKYAKK